MSQRERRAKERRRARRAQEQDGSARRQPSRAAAVGIAATAAIGLVGPLATQSAAASSAVKDINPGPGDSHPQYLTKFAGALYFSANDGTSGYELWKSDGTAAGTVRVKDIDTSNNDAHPGSYPYELTNVGGTLYFAAGTDSDGSELWKSDGTTAGTVEVKDIRPDTESGSYGSYPAQLTNVNGTLYFNADDGTDDEELWKSDGTAAGTVEVKDINPGPSAGRPLNLTNAAGTLYFTADNGTDGYELWKSDGTAAGTVEVKDINPGIANSFPDHMYRDAPSILTNVGGTLYFGATGTDGEELWKSDGTAAGTVEVKNIYPGSYGSAPQNLTNVGDSLYFSADDGSVGFELWKSNGTAAGTVQVKDINPGPDSSYPVALTDVGGTLYFQADDGTDGNELWKSDGTAAGTAQVSDINPGSASSYPRYFTSFAGALYFDADDGTSGLELWKDDLTTTPPDTTPPDTTIDSGPAEGATITTDQATFAFHGTAGDTAKLQCSLDGAPFSDCTSPKSFSGLADGAHTVAFRAVDAAGNHDATPASRSFTVNTSTTRPPDTAVSGVEVAAKGKQPLKGSVLKLKVTIDSQQEDISADVGGVVGTKGKKAKRAPLSANGVKLKGVSADVPAGTTTTLQLKPTGSATKQRGATKKLKRALAKGAKLSAKLTIKLTDKAGNVESVKRTVQIKGKAGKGKGA